MRLKTTAQSRSGVQLPRSVFRQKGIGFLRASIVVLFPFRLPATALCVGPAAPSATVGLLWNCTGTTEAATRPTRFTTISNCFPVSGWFLPPFPPPSCSHTVYNLLESINFSLWSVQSPPPAPNRQGGRQDFRLALSSCIDYAPGPNCVLWSKLYQLRPSWTIPASYRTD